MEIEYLSNSIIPSRSANSIHVMKMCQAFANNGHKVVLHADLSKEQITDVYAYYGVKKCFKIKKRKFGDIKDIKKSYKKIPDLFYARDLNDLLKVAPLKRPLILEVHRPLESKRDRERISKLFSYKNFKRLIAISDALRLEYLRQFPDLKAKTIQVAPDGADLPEKSDYSDIAIKTLGRGTNPKVGYIGHLYPGKGMEMIVQIAARLPNIDFHIVGGIKEDIQYWRKNTNSQNIYFYGFVPHGQLTAYYRYLDIVLAPYQYHVAVFRSSKINISQWMSPLKIFEYMAYTKPIIASDLPVLREVLVDGVNGLLCPPEDVEAWVTAILRLTNDVELRKELAETAHHEFSEHYTWRKRAKKVIKGL
ncbi:glycosyltransferase family 4 protein [Petroclostridium sp. X23]|uniref:glycosyltransferase family 4 protein n=1 Tax=Petroclostridium sp. X23 TaxID=3045146 RepID=UPI0024AE401F|nr:glycosyltransferase family 4 protein [Petroclostridium sp. X23]WHH58360.1 glycosyltransferase family 4 protein [Petroclostridium sp. X23]